MVGIRGQQGSLRWLFSLRICARARRLLWYALILSNRTCAAWGFVNQLGVMESDHEAIPAANDATAHSRVTRVTAVTPVTAVTDETNALEPEGNTVTWVTPVTRVTRVTRLATEHALDQTAPGLISVSPAYRKQRL